MKPDEAPPKSVMVGILRIARGRADGLLCFGATPQSFLASLAPLVAFPLVGAVLTLASRGAREALTGFAMTLCALLVPAVLSFEIARAWGRADRWLRFATAVNWCEWTLPLAACAALLPLGLAMGAGLDATIAGALLVCGLGAYALWLHWFLARKALGLSGLRSVLMVLAVNLGTVTAVLGPRFLAVTWG
jgi:hypothetical protein